MLLRPAPLRPTLLVLTVLATLGTSTAGAQPPCGVFVSPTGTDVSGCGGSTNSPCRTISFGANQAVTRGLGCVMVRAGTYNEVLTLPPGLHVRGGFDAAWNEGTPSLPAYQATITGGFHAVTGQYLAVYANALTTPSKLSALTVLAPTAAGTVNGAGRSSYGVVVRNSTVTLENLIVQGGNGATGAAGSVGSNASPVTATTGMTGGDGGDAVQQIVFCDATSRGSGGSSGTNSAVGSAANGGTGGPGGTMDTSCGTFGCLDGNCSPRPGSAGGNAPTFVAGLYGDGGNGGATCGAPVAGLVGRIGPDGAGGAGGTGLGNFTADFWYANAGGAGTLGSNGGGGGGGGGSGGCDAGTDSYGAGGGGGGAGGLRAPVAGLGGGGGGGSFGLLAVNSTVTVTGCTFLRGTGGAGGRGGNGGRGQDGGQGGSGGAAAGDSDAGGGGGDGGRGGHSGAGGGGAGGDSYGILSRGGTLLQSGNTYIGGTGGTQGAGGTGTVAATNGAVGSNGALGTVRIAVLAADLAVAPASAEAAQFETCRPNDCLLDAPGDAATITALQGAVPNPVRERGVVRFSLARESHVRVQVLDVRGAVVRTLADGRWGAGAHALAYATRGAGARLEPGLYFLRFAADGVDETRRLIVIR